MILLRHVREIDPVTFTAPEFVAYYKMERGITIALMGIDVYKRQLHTCKRVSHHAG